MKNQLIILLSIFCISATFAQNTLSKKEQKQGWQLLFDGNSLTNWRAYQNLNHNWEVKNGVLHNKNNDPNMKVRADLITVKKYKDFAFSCEWIISSGGNSGIIYRASEEFGQPYYTGPEYQVIDNEGYNGRLTELQKTAANYDMEANKNVKTNKVGTWNKTVIIVKGMDVQHWLNGKPVLKYEINSENWKAQYENSKWKNEKKYGQEKEGHIALQDHGHEVWFRNVKIKEL